MFILYTFLIPVVLSAQVNIAADQNVILKEAISPYDLEDEVRAQLDEVTANIRGVIYAAFDTVDDSVSDVFYSRDDYLNAARISIQQEYEILQGQVTTIKELAESENVNIDDCLETTEPLLEQLPQTLTDSLMECLAYSNREVTIIQNTASYRIDTLINEVYIFDFQLDVCAGDFECIAPVAEKIELARIEVPQKIQLEVDAAVALCEDLKVLVNQCTVDKVAQFDAEGANIVADITECVNRILP